MAARSTTDGLGEGQETEFTVVPAHDAAEVVVPLGDFLLTAEYGREGSDLTLTGADGTQVLIQDYFAQAEPPLLLTEGGARITPEIATRLAGSVAPGQYAQAGEALGDQPIGTVDTIEGTVTAIRADGTVVVLEAGAPVMQGDVIETGEDGAINIVFIDNSTFAMDADGRMVLDEFIFDPATQEGSSAFTVVQGVFSFVSGEIAKTGPETMIVDTPTATIGIRGTEVAVRAGAEGEETIITLLAEEDGAVGEIIVSNAAGTQILNVANQTTIVTSSLIAPSVPRILSRSELSELFGTDFEALTSQAFGDSGGRSEGGEEFDSRLEGGEDAQLGDIAPAAGGPSLGGAPLGFNVNSDLLSSDPDLSGLVNLVRGRAADGGGPVTDAPNAPGPQANQVVTPQAAEPAAEPVVADPVVTGPTLAALAVEDPVVEEPVAEDPFAEDPVAEDPFAEDPFACLTSAPMGQTEVIS